MLVWCVSTALDPQGLFYCRQSGYKFRNHVNVFLRRGERFLEEEFEEAVQADSQVAASCTPLPGGSLSWGEGMHNFARTDPPAC